MTQTKYTAAQKSEALRLLDDEGIWAAVAATGAAHNTIYRWHATHVRTLKKTPEEIAIEEDEERILGVRLRRRILQTAMAHVDRSDSADSALEALRWATAFGILYDKLTRVAASTVVPTAESLVDDNEIEIDRALRQSLAEIERKLRNDYERQQTGRDKLGRPVRTPEPWNQVADKLNGDQPSVGGP